MFEKCLFINVLLLVLMFVGCWIIVGLVLVVVFEYCLMLFLIVVGCFVFGLLYVLMLEVFFFNISLIVEMLFFDCLSKVIFEGVVIFLFNIEFCFDFIFLK